MRSFGNVTAIGLAALLVTGVTLGAAPVAADSTDSALGDVFNEDTTATEYASALIAGLGGASDRAGHWFGQNAPGVLQDLLGVEEPSARDKATAVANYYNANNASLERWTNQRTNVSSNKTIEVTFHLGDETATRYVLVNASGGNITRSEMVSSTNRTVGEMLAVCGYAAEKAPAELETFVTEFAGPNEDVTADYLARMKGAYDDDVETTLIASGGNCPRGDA